MKPKFKNYRVIKKIGQGGMGVVYAAEDLALGRLVALKVLAPYLVQDPEILERFRFEARSQARLVHPNITMVYSFLEEDQQAFLVLEFIDGETLESRINREGRIVAVETVAIFRKILGAMDYAHSRGVIHRDIKPSNIAFTSEGNVKIMDFGIALNIQESGRLTKTGHVLGTPHYMAPEQILGQEVTPHSDIYALGITLFEMLTGRLPFDSKSDFEVRMAQIKHPPPPPTSFGFPDITPELEEVILQALAKAPEERFASTGEFRQALEASVTREQLITVVKDLRLDKATQVLKVPRKPVTPPPEPEIEEPAAPPPERQLGEAPTPQANAPGPEASLALPLGDEVQESCLSPPPEWIEESPPPPSSEMPPTEPSAPQLNEPQAQPAITPEPEGTASPPPADVLELSVTPPLEQVEEFPMGSLSEPWQTETPVPPAGDRLEEPPRPQPPEEELEEPSAPALSEPGLAEPVVPPSVELQEEELPPAAPSSGGPQSQELPVMPVLEEPLVPPPLQTGGSSRSRLLFLPLALLPLLAWFIFFRANFSPTPPSPNKTMVSTEPEAKASEKLAPSSQLRAEKTPGSAVPPGGPSVIPVPHEVASAELGKVAKDQPEKEKPMTMAALPLSEKKAEMSEVKEPKPVDLQKTIKNNLATNGFAKLGVLVDAKKGVVISGNVKNMVQKNKVMQIVSSMGLSVPADYSQLKIAREAVVETVKKKAPEERPRATRPEAAPKPSPPEALRKPLPPRMDRGNIQF
jgi:serine/threonine protein kinase